MKLSQLKIELYIYKKLKGITGIPKLYGFNTEGDYNFLVIELLGKSLEKQFKACNKKFSVSTCISLADQMVLLFFI